MLRFYFDFISPYAYLAWTQVRDLAAKHGKILQPVPVLFAGILNAHGTKGPAEVPAKRRYLFKDVARKAIRLKVPVAPPIAHPFNPLVALRTATVSGDPVAIDALFTAFWAERQPIDTPEAVASVLSKAGFDGSDLVEQAKSQEVKDAVRIATEDAIGAGVFGVPTMEIDDEMFWGTDSLPDLELYLSGKVPPIPDVGEIPMAAVRKAVRD